MFRMNNDHGTVLSAESTTTTANVRNTGTNASAWK